MGSIDGQRRCAWLRRCCFAGVVVLCRTASGADTIHPIQRVSYADMTFSLFQHEFRYRDRPVIITGVPRSQQPCFGRLGRFKDGFLRQCQGSVNVKAQGDSREHRKACAPGVDVDFGDFLDLFPEAGGLDRLLGTAGPFFADWPPGLREKCGDLWRYVRIPAYFTGAAHTVGPTFYFAQKGFNQSMHQDYLAAELWTSVCRGRKHLRIIPVSVFWEGYGRRTDAHRWCLRPEGEPFGVPVWEGELLPGEILWFGAGALHAVDNVEDTINIVSNVVDAGNLGPLSWVGKGMLEDQRLLDKFPEYTDDMVGRLPLYDELGVVRDGAASARGFPLWSALELVHGLQNATFPLRRLR